MQRFRYMRKQSHTSSFVRMSNPSVNHTNRTSVIAVTLSSFDSAFGVNPIMIRKPTKQNRHLSTEHECLPVVRSLFFELIVNARASLESSQEGSYLVLSRPPASWHLTIDGCPIPLSTKGRVCEVASFAGTLQRGHR